MNGMCARLLAVVFVLGMGWIALPQETRAAEAGGAAATGSGISVRDAWARVSPGGAHVTAVYLTLVGGTEADSLTGASTPIGASAEVHESSNENGIMKMRPTGAIPVSPHQTVTFAPGGYHIMVMGLKESLQSGQSFPLTLTFAHTAPITVPVAVQALGQAEPSGNRGH